MDPLRNERDHTVYHKDSSGWIAVPNPPGLAEAHIKPPFMIVRKEGEPYSLIHIRLKKVVGALSTLERCKEWAEESTKHLAQFGGDAGTVEDLVEGAAQAVVALMEREARSTGAGGGGRRARVGSPERDVWPEDL